MNKKKELAESGAIGFLIAVFGIVSICCCVGYLVGEVWGWMLFGIAATTFGIWVVVVCDRALERIKSDEKSK